MSADRDSTEVWCYLRKSPAVHEFMRTRHQLGFLSEYALIDTYPRQACDPDTKLPLWNMKIVSKTKKMGEKKK